MGQQAGGRSHLIYEMGDGLGTQPLAERKEGMSARTRGWAGRLCECLWPGGHRLHGPHLLGGQLLQACLSSMKHLFHALLLLEDLLHVFLRGQGVIDSLARCLISVGVHSLNTERPCETQDSILSAGDTVPVTRVVILHGFRSLLSKRRGGNPTR